MKDLAILGVDKKTKERLLKLADGVPMARYLRELSLSLTGQDPIENKLNSIEAKLDLILLCPNGGVTHK